MFTDLRSVPSGIKYVRPKEECDFTPVVTLDWFVTTDVPTAEDHRSLYLHALNVLLESVCDASGDAPARRDASTQRSSWDAVFTRVRDFWFAERATLNQSHRRLVWLVMARTKFILSRNTPVHRNVHACTFARARYIQTSRTRIPQQSVQEVWQTIFALLLVWGTLAVDADVVTYVDALFTQIGRFTWLALPDRRVFDHPAYTTTVHAFDGAGVTDGSGVCFTGERAQAMYCINEAFLLETERIFYVLLRDIELWKRVYSESESTSALGYTLCRAPRAKSYARVIAWLRESVAVEARREGIAETFEKRVYGRRALPGEVERLVEQDPHQLHTAYNAIARFRPNVIDTTSELIDAETTIEDLLDHVQTWDPADAASAASAAASAQETNILRARRQANAAAERRGDATDVVLAATATTLDAMFVTDTINFLDWFTTTALPLPRTKRAVPMFVLIGGAWRIAHENEFIECETIIDAIECWITRICANDATLQVLEQVAPNVDTLFAAHRAITGETAPTEEARIAKEAAAMCTNTVQLPACYTGSE